MKDIKQECELLFQQIDKAKSRLRELQKECNHTNTFVVNYSQRIGHIQPAIICSDCKQFIKYTTEITK